MEESTILGHPDARLVLSSKECQKQRLSRSVKHLITAANFGHDDAIELLKTCYKGGYISKVAFAAALLRAHQAAVAATRQIVHKGRRQPNGRRIKQIRIRRESLDLQHVLNQNCGSHSITTQLSKR